MKRLMQLLLYFSIIALFLAGCEGCFDGEITRKVDYPYITVTPETNYEITFNSSTKGASFKYTLDGTDPKTSGSAQEGTTLTIDFLTEVRVFAYKDGHQDSAVVYYRIPTTNAIREVNYKSDLFVQDHWYKADDVFGREKIAIAYDAKGEDDQWFSDDDQVSEYTLLNYEGDDLKEGRHYTGPGDDGKWMTADDEFDSVSTFTVDEKGRKIKEVVSDSSGNETETITYTWNGDGELLASEESSLGTKIEYTYSAEGLLETETHTGDTEKTITYTAANGQLDSAVVENSSGTQIGYIDITNAYELNKRYKLVAEYDGDIIKQKIKYLGYGEDTDVGVVTYKYDGDKVIEEHCFANKAGTFDVKHTYFTYDGDILAEEKIEERFWSKELYDWDWRITIKKYSYNEDGTLARVDYHNDEKFISKYELYTYEASTQLIDTFERPELPKKTVSVDLTISLEGKVGKVLEGSYTMEGRNFDIDGNLTVEDLGFPEEKKAFLKEAKKRIQSIIENTEIDAQGATVTGTVAGSVRVEADAYVDEDGKSSVKVWFYFNEYDDGEMMIDGELLSEFEGTFDISGKIVARSNGYIQGDVIVEDGNPEWTDEDYNQINYTVVTLDGNDEPTKEVVYNAFGADSDWKATTDNKIECVIIYTVDGAKTTKSVYTNAGTDKSWETDDDVEYERFVEERDGDKVMVEEYYSIYGTYQRDFDGDSVDDPLEKAQLKYHTWCHWDYNFGWSWEYL